MELEDICPSWEKMLFLEVEVAAWARLEQATKWQQGVQRRSGSEKSPGAK